jgi:transcriptional regulator with XRE-family HTH domain
MTREQIAQKLKQLREKSGYTQKQIGSFVGKAYQTVASWESGKGQPDADTFLLLCSIYKVDNVMQMFRGTETVKDCNSELSDIPRINAPLHSKIDKLDADDLRIIQGTVEIMLQNPKYTASAALANKAIETVIGKIG